MIRVANDNKLLVEPMNSSTNLGNGLQINNETQNRKDIIKGKVISSRLGRWENKIVYFPLYSALPFSHDGNNYMVVDISDVLIEED